MNVQGSLLSGIEGKKYPSIVTDKLGRWFPQE